MIFAVNNVTLQFADYAFLKNILGHKPIAILNTFESKKEVLQRDLQELEKYIFPKYSSVASSIPFQKAEINKNSQKLKIILTERGEAWHKEIDNLINNLKSDLDEMEHKYLAILNEKEYEIKRTMSEITKNIDFIKALLKSADVCRVSEYKSRNGEFRKLPRKLMVTLPSFSPQKIDKHQIYKRFGSLSELSIDTEEHNSTLELSTL